MMFKIIIISTMFIGHLHSCTETIMRAQDSSIILGRTMDFDVDISYRFSVEPKGTKHQAVIHPLPHACKDKQFKWTSLHKAIVIRAVKIPSASAGGINEHGLSASTLSLDEDSVYVNITEANCENAISLVQVVDYILANFESVAQVKEAIETNKFPEVVAVVNDIFAGFHYAVTDKSGAAIVIEYTAAGRKVHTNTLGVVTNHPPYDWHMENIKYYVQLTNLDHKARKYYDPQLHEHILPYFPESGLIGMPGDYSSPSRFVRAASLLRFAERPKTSDKAIIASFHLLNAVDTMKGPVEGRADISTYTFWQVVKDLTNGCFYYKTYDYLRIRKLCLKDVPDKPASLLIERKSDTFADSVEDVSTKLKHAKNEL